MKKFFNKLIELFYRYIGMISFYTLIAIIGIYYGILPLFGVKVWVKYSGFVLMNKFGALVFIFISLGILYKIHIKKDS